MSSNFASINADRSDKGYSVSIMQHAAEFIKTGVSFLPPNHNLNKFVIFGQGRCGSTLLTTLIDSHPEIVCEDELLSMRHMFPFARVNRFGRTSRSDLKAFGFHLKPWHVTRVLTRDLKSFTDKLDEYGYRFIHLKRSNWFLQSISQVKLHEYSIIHAKSKSEAPTKPVAVDTSMLLFLIKEKEALAAQELSVISSLSNPAISVIYEENLSSPEKQQATASRIFSELKLSDSKVSTPLRKVSPNNWRDGVSNASEVEDFMNNSEFAHFLGD